MEKFLEELMQLTRKATQAQELKDIIYSHVERTRDIYIPDYGTSVYSKRAGEKEPLFESESRLECHLGIEPAI